MATDIRTIITKEDTCPDIVLNNITSYPEDTSHDISNFNTYVKLTLLLSNGITITFTSGYPNQVLPPDELLRFVYQNECLVGKFTASYIALPTPPDSPVSGQSAHYDTGDNFYYDGVIYTVRNIAGFNIPQAGQFNSAIIAAALLANGIQVIQESGISFRYKSEISFVHWCNLDTCLLDKIGKLNCLIVKEPTRNDLCEKELYEQVLQLNFIKEFVDSTIMVEPYISTPELEYQIKSAYNYVNSICCCKDCKDC